MLKYFGLSVILVVTILAASSAKNLDEAKIARVVGGDPTNITNYPYQVSVQVKNPDSTYTHYCGGSIIRADCILTAAHCIVGIDPKKFLIAAGSSIVYDKDSVRRYVRRAIMHNMYNKDEKHHDLGLIFLSEALPLNGVTMAAIKWATRAPRHGDLASVTGWGATIWGGQMSNNLLHAYMPIVCNNLCANRYGRVFGPGLITPSMICASYDGVGGIGTCQGDSGGPVVVNNKVVGVVSWANECARPEFPSVFANVAHMQNWIRCKLQQYPFKFIE